jgi:hypothetical protein
MPVDFELVQAAWAGYSTDQAFAFKPTNAAPGRTPNSSSAPPAALFLVILRTEGAYRIVRTSLLLGRLYGIRSLNAKIIQIR